MRDVSILTAAILGTCQEEICIDESSDGVFQYARIATLGGASLRIWKKNPIFQAQLSADKSFRFVSPSEDPRRSEKGQLLNQSEPNGSEINILTDEKVLVFTFKVRTVQECSFRESSKACWKDTKCCQRQAQPNLLPSSRSGYSRSIMEKWSRSASTLHQLHHSQRKVTTYRYWVETNVDFAIPSSIPC